MNNKSVDQQMRSLLHQLGDVHLRSMAGMAVFARGKSYAANGAVQDLEDLPSTPDCLMGV